MRQRVSRRWIAERERSHVLVLIESNDPALAISDFWRYQCAGLDVALCTGPEEDPSECPLVRGERCKLVEGADVVLSALGNGPVLDQLAHTHGVTPVVVKVPASDPVVPVGCVGLPSTWSVEGQIRMLRATHRGRDTKEKDTEKRASKKET